MRPANFLLTTGAVTASLVNAFLIPPEISTESLAEIVADFEKMSENMGVKTTFVTLACDGCYLGKEGGNLILNVDIPQPDMSSVIINDASFYPFKFNPVISAPLIKTGHSVIEYVITGTDDSLISAKLGYNLVIQEDKLEDQEMIKITLKIISVDGRKISPWDVDYLDMMLAKDKATGELNIMNLNIQREQSRAAEEFSCTSLFCKWASEIEDTVNTFREKAAKEVDSFKAKHFGGKGCFGKNKQSSESVASPIVGESDYTSNHHPHHHTHGYIAQTPQDGISDDSELTLAKIFRQVLFPIFVGVLAGMGVSLLGMIVGHFSVRAYQKLKCISFACLHAVERGRKQQEQMQNGRGADCFDAEAHKGLLASGEILDGDDAPPEYVATVIVVEHADDKQ